jgi:hypothetical protein
MSEVEKVTGFEVTESGETERQAPVAPVKLPSDIIPLASSVEQSTSLATGVSSGSGFQGTERLSMLPQILEKIHDPNFPLAEVNRLIAIEIAFIAQEMARLRGEVKHGNHSETFLQKSYEANIKALAQLEKSLTSTDILAHRDILNMDGPKFQWLFGQVVDSFKKACQDALGRDGETMVQSIMKHWRDELAMRESDWRSGVEKINAKNPGK